MNFTVIDFETANSKRASACALGLVKVKNGQIIEKNEWLIRPKDMHFNGMNIAIHGIRPEDVENEPEFDTLYFNEIKEKLEGELVIAHNASFDMSVLRNTFDLYGIEYPTFEYLCTVKIGKKTWLDLPNHKLDTLSKFLRYSFKHHDALDDCLACANVLINALEKQKHTCPYQLADSLGLQIGKIYPNSYQPCSENKKAVKKK